MGVPLLNDSVWRQVCWAVVLVTLTIAEFILLATLGFCAHVVFWGYVAYVMECGR